MKYHHCNVCKLDFVEDEKHFLFNCNIYYNERREFYEECAKIFRNFSDMNEDDKLKNIMSHKCWKITLRYVNSHCGRKENHWSMCKYIWHLNFDCCCKVLLF